MLKLILSNIKKHLFLFGLIGALVFIASFYLFIGLNVLSTVNGSLIKAISEGESGDLIVVSKDVSHIDLIGMANEKKIKPLKEWRSLLEFLEANRHVRRASPRLRVRGMVRSEKNNFPMILVGVDPQRNPGLLPGLKLDDGRLLSGDHEMNLYYRHSDRLSAKTGDLLGINVETVDGYMNFDTARLVGTLNYHDLNYYSEISFYAFVSLDFLNSMLQNEKPVVGEILLRLDQEDSSDAVIAAVEKRFGSLYRFIRPENSSFLVESVSRLTQFVIYAVASLLLVMVYLASSLLMHLSLETRRKEIGIYVALGVSTSRIALLFGGELLVVVIFCSGLGVYFGQFVISHYMTEGIAASIIPLQIIFGMKQVIIHTRLATYGIIALLLSTVLAGTIASVFYTLRLYRPVELVSEL